MPEQFLVYSRVPSEMGAQFGERFELMDAAGNPPHEFSHRNSSSSSARMITAGLHPLGGAMMDRLPTPLRSCVTAPL